MTITDIDKQWSHGDIGDDGCPCGQVVEKDYFIQTHCWKSSYMCHPFACVHYSNTKGKKHAQYLRKYIKNAWHCDCDIQLDGEMEKYE